MLLASLIFLVYGWSFAQFGALQYSEIAGLPMLSIYIAWPLAGATMALFLLEKFVEDVHILRGEIAPPKHEIPKAE
jgi:TRAP-type C4-dicarboxylate transport system permease small subunit